MYWCKGSSLKFSRELAWQNDIDTGNVRYGVSLAVNVAANCRLILASNGMVTSNPSRVVAVTLSVKVVRCINIGS